ncbi:hypothetical protein GCM10028862_20490 [Luteimonas pelagia]
MQLHYCRIEGGNFGDDLNLSLWPALFPDIAGSHPEVRLYGVGTVLGGDQPAGPKVVLGSGCGYRDARALGDDWRVYWVRGPGTARRLGLDPGLGLGDPAVLWAGLRDHVPTPGRVGFIPHFRSLQRFEWQAVADAAGVALVDPRGAPDAVAAGLAGCERVLCESLHGAIFCDAMGIPWRAVVLARRFNDFKWRDWLDTLGMPLRPVEMPVELLERLSTAKALGNRLARLADRGGPAARNHLRPTRAATAADRDAAAATLRAWAADAAAFTRSDAGVRARRRDAMRDRCAAFADDFGLRFAG